MKTISGKILLIALLMGFVFNLKANNILTSWNINEGQGKLINAKPKKYNGFIFGKGKAAPVWEGKELFFRGRNGYGGIKVLGGGSVLQGSLFEISLEVKPSDKKVTGYLLASKHYSYKDGGFSLYYVGPRKMLYFNFSDGLKKYIYPLFFKKDLSPEKWTKINISYNGLELKFNVDGKLVQTIKKTGLRISKNSLPLYIGAYTLKYKSDYFEGGIRKVFLSRPLPKAKEGELISINSKGTPVIDGKLDDAIWEKVPFHSNFVYFHKGKTATPQTSFALTYDDKNFYIAVRCFDKNTANLKRNTKERDGMVSADDSIDIFIDPDMSGDHCFQLELNAANVQNDAVLTFFGNRRREDFNMKWLSAVNIKKNEWTVEISIPFSELMIRPDNPGNWHFNICRACTTVGKNPYSTWGCLKKGEKSLGFKDFKLFKVITGLPSPDFSTTLEKKIISSRNRWGFNKKPPTAKNAIIPVHDIIYVANNMVVPNYFLNHYYGTNILKADTSYVFDLPIGIELLHVGGLKPKAIYDANHGYYKWHKEKTVQHDGLKYNRYIIKPIIIHPRRQEVGPLYLRSSQKDGKLQKIYYFARSKDGNQKINSISLLTKKFPKPGMPTKLISCYAWLSVWTEFSWPDIIENLASLGFNTFPILPNGDTFEVHPEGDTFSQKQISDLVHKAKDKGFKILYIDSPFSNVRLQLEGNSTSANGTPKSNIKDACPSYRGKFYTKQLQKIKNYASLLKPDYAHFDIEQFSAGAFRGKTGQCQRCAAYIKKSAKSTSKAMCSLGTKIMGDIKNSLKEGIKKHKLPTPMNGNYNTEPGGYIYDGIFNFDEMNQAGAAQSCHPVFYTTSFANVAGKKLRRLRKMINKNTYLIPWTTTGYLGTEYPVKWVYDYVLELYMAGAKGIYWFSPFIEGADLYYHAKAMELINPVSALIYGAEPLEGVKVNNIKFNVTGLKNKNEYLLLVSSYTKNPSGVVEISLPVNVSGKIWDIARKKQIGKVKNSKVIINFMPGCEGAHTAVYYIGNNR